MAKVPEYIQLGKTYLDKFRSWKRRVLQKKVKHHKFQILHNLKSVSFKNRNDKISKYDQIIDSNPDIYFTTDLVKTGFTDQLIGFSFLYKLGRSIGLNYYHTRLSSHRSTAPFLFYPYSKKKINDTQKKDIFDFLGINSFLAKTFTKPNIQNAKKVKIDLNASLNFDKVDDFKTLLDEIKLILYPYISKDQKILLTLECKARTYFKFYRYVARRPEFTLNFRKIFEQQKRRNQSRFRKDAHKILVHIRQGDTGTIQTPWNTFIPTWYEVEGKFTQFKSAGEIPNHKLINVSDFYDFLKDFFESTESQKYSTIIYSDGFKKTFRAIYQSYKKRDISRQEIKELRELEPVYDEKEFKKFRDFKNTDTVVGEEVEKLHDLIHSFLETDIMVFGTHGSLIPKLSATYGNKTNMPFMIFLYKSKQPYLDYLGYENSADYLLFVNLQDYDIDHIRSQVENYLKTKNE